ncbi:putative 18S rRNA (guanine-N(7))-methyltransferase [Armadillidium vulgare]|nr:putative 18S rRNA (guanine-N(7))-methyltransferase [Armadillidium vulgare]
MASTRRPEHLAPPELYYNEVEAKKYTQNSRIIEVQEKCSTRALELLALPDDEPCFLLDLGCGSGLSGEVITENGHYWTGFDISQAMLDVAVEREVEGDMVLSDLGQGLPLRPASFDGAISISAIQWLCNADKKEHVPAKRLYKFFMTLYACLCRGSRAVFQFYPENDKQVELIVHSYESRFYWWFSSGLSKFNKVFSFMSAQEAKKIFLVLMTGGSTALPKALTGEESGQQQHTQALYERRDRTRGFNRTNLKREWILRKKERRRKQGRDVRPDSKFTARKRSGKF